VLGYVAVRSSRQTGEYRCHQMPSMNPEV
jgi:hypothetical protein